MRAYTGFAAVYDSFMKDMPYEAWARRITGRLSASGIKDGLILDLACGTGTMTRLLAEAGYDMIGADASEEMLAQAMEKNGTGSILYLEQDMREFELYGTDRAVVCVCDALNYITNPEELVRVFRLVDNYLDPGGLFLFDFNTPAEYAREERISYTEECGGIYLIGRNDFEREEGLNFHTVTFFVPEDDAGTLYGKIEETHEQRAYTLEEMKEALSAAGLAFVSAEDESGNAPGPGTGRCFVTAREVKKETAGNGR